MEYAFPDSTSSEWIAEYNSEVKAFKSRQLHEDANADWSRGEHGIHHVLPRSRWPELADDEDNKVYVTFQEHMHLHWLLWKADPSWASALWFGCVYGRKHKLWNLPGGEEEYEQLKRDLKLSRKCKKQSSGGSR